MVSEVVFIGGRSGVGKTSVSHEMHAQLSAAGVRHCVIDGDVLDMAYPPPWEHDLAERNLAAMWRNYRDLGHRRLIYTNTVCVLPEQIDMLTAAMGDDPVVTAVLLTCTDVTARERLGQREIGSELNRHVASSARLAEQLSATAADRVKRLSTDGRTVSEIASDIVELSGWMR